MHAYQLAFANFCRSISFLIFFVGALLRWLLHCPSRKSGCAIFQGPVVHYVVAEARPNILLHASGGRSLKSLINNFISGDSFLSEIQMDLQRKYIAYYIACILSNILAILGNLEILILCVPTSDRNIFRALRDS